MDKSVMPQSTEPEIWLPVVGWEGFYEVSDLGRVWSMLRMTATGRRGGRILKTAADGGGYLFVGLSRNGQTKLRKVHHLVLEAFVGPRPQGEEACHGPGGRTDNRAANLSWGTHTKNIQDKIRDCTRNTGERHGQSKLTAEIVSECRRRAAQGENQSSLAREFDVEQGTMWRALIGVTWFEVETTLIVPGEARGEGHGMAKLTQADVEDIRARCASGEFQRVVAADYGVNRRTISKIVTGLRWRVG